LDENVTSIGKMQNAYKILITKPEENEMLGKSMHKGEDNIKVDVKEQQGWRLWTGLIWLRVGTCGRPL
jgi:hypothetical protein